MATTFTRNMQGRYNEETNIYSMIFGENAYLTEDELNEMQWNLIHKDQLFRQTLLGSGIFAGTIAVSDAHNLDDILYIESSKNKLVVLIDGQIIPIGGNKLENQPSNVLSQDNRLLLKVSPAPINRQDLVILETWYQSINQKSEITKFGGEDNESLEYEIRDTRINTETSRRLQLTWRIRIIENESSIENVESFGYDKKSTGQKYKKKNDFYETRSALPIKDVANNYITDGVVKALPLLLIDRKANSPVLIDDIDNLFPKSSISIDNLSSNSGTFKIDTNTTINGDASISGNTVIGGDLTVIGNATYIKTIELNVDDNIIKLNSGFIGNDPILNAGLEVERGSLLNTQILWNETSDTWQITEDGTNFHNILHSGQDNVDLKSFKIEFNETENSIDFIIK